MPESMSKERLREIEEYMNDLFDNTPLAGKIYRCVGELVAEVRRRGMRIEKLERLLTHPQLDLVDMKMREADDA